MSQPCLRNMSCKCPLCMGEDITELLAITKTISSNISYGEPGEEESVPPPATSFVVSNSPPVKPAAPVRPSLKSRMGASKPPAPEKITPLEFKDVDTSNTHTTETPIEHTTSENNSVSNDSNEALPTSSDDPLQMEELEAKVSDKNWKVRKEIYEELKSAFETRRAVEGGNVTELFGKMVDDSNAAALECGIAAVLAYSLQASPQSWNNAVVGRVLPKVIDKGFSGRPGTVKLAEELVLEFVHLGSAEDTIGALLEGTKNKKPKVPPLCVNSILESIKVFGPRVVPVATVKKELKNLCESTVNNVRPTALKIICELYRWTGAALVQDLVATLRPAQQTEYETMIKEITPGQAAPTRFLKGKEPKAATSKGAAKGGKSNDSNMAASTTIDPREFAETVNLLEKLPKTEFKSKMALPKWSEKVGALSIILELVGSVPKLANGDYGDLVQTLKLCTQDSNVNIVAKSIEVLGVLSDGLRRQFSQYARILLPVLLRKLSDKKSNILNATHQALDLFQQHSMPIDAMMDELKLSIDGSSNKIPAARAQTVLFVERCISKKTINVSDSNLMKTFGEWFSMCIDDSDPGLRKAGVDAMVTLVKSSDAAPRMVKSTLDYLEKRQPRSFKSIEAAIGASGGSEPKASASSTPKIPSAAPKIPTSNSVPKESSKAQTAAPARSNSLKKLSSTTSAKPSSKASPSNADTISLSAEDAEQLVTNLELDEWDTIAGNFASAKWTDRKAAFEGLEESMKMRDQEFATANFEPLLVYIGSQAKGFKESNVNVLKCAFQAVGTIASLCESISGACISYIVPPAVDKLGDRKLSEAIRPMFSALSELVGPAVVLNAVFNHIPNVKTPLALFEVIELTKECVKDFGVGKCNPREIIEFAKGSSGLESTNPKLRAASISLFGTMYSQLGDSMRPLLNLDSWKSLVKDSVESEFKRVGYSPMTAKSTITKYIKGETEEDDTANDTLFGRVDISAKITRELLADMQNEDDKIAWKKRLDAMEQAQRICEETGLSIELTKSVQELMKSLKARLSDSNANLKTKAVVVIGVVATSIGTSVNKLTKLVGNHLVVGVSDNKKAMQQACLDTLTKWVVHNDKTCSSCFESLLPYIAEALKNPVGRAELLGWTVSMTQSIDEKIDLKCLIENTIDSLLDKSTEAREKAQLLLIDVFKSAGKESVLAGCRDIVPAKMRTLKPVIDKASHAAFGQQNIEEEKPKAVPIVRTNSTATRTPIQQIQPPTSTLVTPIPSPVVPTKQSSSAMLLSSDKMTRLDRNRKNKWIFDATDPAEVQGRKEQLESEWSPYLNVSLKTKLFAVSYEKGMMEAIDDLSRCVSTQPDDVITSLDFILKWSTFRIVDNNVQALVKMLDLLVKLFQMLFDHGYELDDVEANIFLPYLCQESGQQKPRFRMRFRDVLRLIVETYSSPKLIQFLLECITNSKNSKSRSECFDLIEYIADKKGYGVIGRKTLRDISKYVDSSDKEVRESAISSVVKIFTILGESNTDKFFNFCNITSQKSMDLVLQKIKYLPTERKSMNQKTMDVSNGQTINGIPQLTKSISTIERPVSRFERSSTPSKLLQSSSLTSAISMEPSPVLQHDDYDDSIHNRIDIRGMIFPPLERLLLNHRELTKDIELFSNGKDALKSLYKMACESNNNFILENVNEILLRLCQIMHGSFGKTNSSFIDLNILSLCISTISAITKIELYNSNIQRVAIERLLLESCYGMLDGRLDDFEHTFSKRIMTALNRLALSVAYCCPIDQVYPGLLYLLERIVHGKLDDYIIHDKENRKNGKPILEELIGKIICKTTQRELTKNIPFQNVEISNILHIKHRYFTSYPDHEIIYGRNAMKLSLKYFVEYFFENNKNLFQNNLNKLPISSPIHRFLMEMEYNFNIPKKDDIKRDINETIQLFETSNDTNTKIQAAMHLVETKMNSDIKIDLDNKKEYLKKITEKLELTDYNRTKDTTNLKTNLNNIIKEKNLDTIPSTPIINRSPHQSMALSDLKKRLALFSTK